MRLGHAGRGKRGRDHEYPVVHADGAVFDLMSNGFPGPAMPKWKMVLPDTDGWNLVNFILTLPPKTQP